VVVVVALMEYQQGQVQVSSVVLVVVSPGELGQLVNLVLMVEPAELKHHPEVTQEVVLGELDKNYMVPKHNLLSQRPVAEVVAGILVVGAVTKLVDPVGRVVVEVGT